MANVTNMLKKCEQGKYSRDNYVINFTSANNAGKLPLLYPYQYADEINNNITGADSSKKYNWKRVTDSSATPVHYGWIVMDFVTEGMCRPIYSTNKFVEQKYGLHYADSSEDKRFYYLGYAFDQESGNIGRMVAVDYTPNGGSTTRYDKQVITTDAAAYKAMLEKKQLYPGISYTVTLYEVGLADKILSNKIAYSVQLPQETPDVTLTYPEWVMDGAASVEMKLSYSLAYKNDGVTYAVYDPVQNKIVVQGSEPTLQVPNPVPGRAYDGTINVAYPEGRTFWYEGRTKYEPKILAQPEQLVTTPTCDSVEVGWNYSGDVEQFRIALENSTGDKLFEKYTTAQSVEFIGLDAGTDYVARVTAIGGGMENTSEPLSFTTAPPPQATISPTFHYFDNPSDPKTLNVAIDTAVTGDHYTWNIQYAGETGWQPIGTDASSLSIRANEFNTYGSIALIKCDVTWDGGSATTNRIVLCGVPAKPANFQSPSQGLDSITLSWDAIPGTEAYQLTYPNVELWIAPEATSVTITGLEHGTEYDFTLIAVGQGPLGHRYESDSAECTAQTLADAEAPENVQISKVPEEIAAYTEDITYTATAGLPPGGGVLSYQWQVQGTDGLFVDMAGETRNTCTVSPSTEIMAKKIRCVVTNTLHGTTASVTTDELYILFKPPAVTEITATPSDSLGAKRIDVKWKNPAMFDHYIVVCTPASAGAGVQTLPDGVVSQIAAQAILPEGSRVRIVKGNGAPGAEKELQLHGLKPGTAYNIHIENVLKHPFEEGYLPADLSDIVTVRVATLPGAGTPVITDNSGDQTVEDGKRATFSATATAPDYGNTFYRWRAISPTLEESAVLSRGTLAGTQVLECSADASLDLDGYYYILDVVSINNGDVSIATSQPVTLHVWREAPPSPPNETSGANTGDSSSILLWIILAIISAVAILVLKKVHRKNEGIEE